MSRERIVAPKRKQSPTLKEVKGFENPQEASARHGMAIAPGADQTSCFIHQCSSIWSSQAAITSQRPLKIRDGEP